MRHPVFRNSLIMKYSYRYIITIIVRASELEPELIVDLDYETLSAVVN